MAVPYRNVSLERRLPLLMTGLLLVILGAVLVVTHRALTRHAEAAARGRLAGATVELHRSITAAMQLRERGLDSIARLPNFGAALARGDSLDPVAAAALTRPFETFVTRGQELRVDLWNRAGRRFASLGGPEYRPRRFGLEIETGAGEGPTPPTPPWTGVRDSSWHTPIAIRNGRAEYWLVRQVTDSSGQLLGTIAVLRQVVGGQGAAAALRHLTGEDIAMYLRNRKGDVWVALAGNPVPPSVPDTTGDERRFAERQGAGRVLLVEEPVPGTPFVTTLEVPMRSILAPAERTTQRLALVCLLLALAGGVVTWRIARGVTKPLRTLTASADAIAVGKPVPVVVGDRNDEIGRLARSFDVMSREIAHSRRELEHRIEEVERANRTKADFLAMISHELRTPLNAIAGYAQLVEMGVHGPVTDAQREALGRISRSQEHLLHLIDEVLSFARIDAGRVAFNLGEVGVAPAVSAAMSMVAPQAGTKGIRLISHCHDETLVVLADREKLGQILINLLANAIKFTPEAGVVEVMAQPVNTDGRDRVRIQVRDSGPGIAPRHHATIFEPFDQGNRALNRPSEGVGLGLAISRDLARGMDAHLEVASEVGAGATFTVDLPRFIPAPQMQAQGAAAAPRERIGTT